MASKLEIQNKINELKVEIFALKKSINKDRDERVITLFLEGNTLQQIGDVMGFTREYARQILKKHGFTRADGGQAVSLKNKRCLVEGCTHQGPYSLGYCRKHYSKLKYHGDPLKVSPRFEHSDKCMVEGCNRPYKSNGYCNTHRTRWYTTGDAGPAEILPAGKHKNRGAVSRKLTEEQMKEIRTQYVPGVSFQKSEFSTVSLGKKYGVSSSLISRVVNNKI